MPEIKKAFNPNKGCEHNNNNNNNNNNKGTRNVQSWKAINFQYRWSITD